MICPRVYLLPTPEEPFSALAKGESFSKLDISHAYKQMKVEKSSQPLLTIDTHLGLYWYARLPFRISTAQHYGRKQWPKYCRAYLRLYTLLMTYWLQVAQEWSMKQTCGESWGETGSMDCDWWSQSAFFQKELEFLGHLISQDGIKPTQSWIEGVKAVPAPCNKQELQSLLGMVTYNAKFIPSLSQTLHPLY